MNSVAFLLGTGLVRKEKLKKNTQNSRASKELRCNKKRGAVEAFLREILGTGLLQIEKKY